MYGAEVLVISSDLLTGPDPSDGHYDLDVSSWTQVNGEDLCSGEPFLGQPITGSGAVDNCSGFLVGPNLVVTAGHCVDFDGDAFAQKYPCDGLYHVVFDWADQGPIGPGTTSVELDGDDVFECEEVLIDTVDDESIPLPEFNPEGDNDYAVLQLVASDTGRLPLVMERIERTAVGNQALVLGHPQGLPLKSEIAPVTLPRRVGAHILGGNSGSGVVGLETGKLAFNITSGYTDWPRPSFQGCALLDFSSGLQFGRGTLASVMNKDVPPIGLQVVPQGGELSATYYGPPTTQADFPTFSLDIEVPDDSLPSGVQTLDWEVRQDVWTFDQPFVVVSGPSSGSFAEGQTATVEFAPNVTSAPGLVEEVLPFFDYLYETREPIVHRAYVGIEGFLAMPDEDLLGEGGLGVPHGENRDYTLTNRWIVSQDVTVSATEDWVQLDGQDGTIPQTLTMPPSGGAKVMLPLVVDGSGMDPGDYFATVTFSSDDSGTPAFERQQTVRFDHCRQLYPYQGQLPWEPVISPGQEASIDFQVAANPSMGLIDDVDIVAQEVGTGFGRPEYKVTLVSPDGTEVVLKDFDDQSLAYYDQDEVTTTVLLNLLDDRPATGLWSLVFENHLDSENDLEVVLSRWDVRLHVDAAPQCE